MKLGIISDLHIGRRMYRTDENGYNKFEQIGYKALKQYTNILLDENPDLIINGGDVFDISNPPILAMTKYQEMQNRLKDIPTMTILGNHDFSFINRNNKCSATQMANHTYFADYEIKSVEFEDILYIMMPYIYDKDEKIYNMFKECKKIAENSTNSKKILITHGITEKYHRESFINDPFLIPDKLVSLFDLVIIGHIHTPFDYKQGKTLVISPGAMIDYQAHEDRTGPIILDTDTMKFHKIKVKTPHIIKKNATESNINDILSNVTEDIYQITYKGDTSVIDNDIFLKAKEKTVNLVIDVTQPEELVETTMNSTLLGFDEWLKANYSDYVEVFRRAKEEITGYD
ncbi:MAG: metallophosphoesterase [Bacilli bacterium]|nr:metallophosphoesterase [Bacilli bacterium]